MGRLLVLLLFIHRVLEADTKMSALLPITKGFCPVCNTANPEIISYSDTVDFRGMELDVENLQESKCRNCGNKWVTGEQRAHNNSVMRNAYALVRDELREKHGLLTGQEIAHMREIFALNQREAAALFGGGYNAFNKYESGEVLQSFPMDRLLRLSAAVGKPAIEFLKNVFSPPNFIVLSTLGPTELRIVVNVGGGALFNPKTIYGTSSELKKLEPKLNIEHQKNLNTLPMMRETYSVYTNS